MTCPAVEALTDIVARATRAPSMHNTQPWRFRVLPATDCGIDDAVIEIRSDRARSLRVADPDGWAARVACGAAALGVSLGIAARGHRPRLAVLPDPADPDLVARALVGPARAATPEDRDLHAAMAHRRSNRRPFNAIPAPRGAGALLLAAAHAESAWLHVCDARARAEVAGVTREAQRRLEADPAYRAELAAWVRDSADDGVPRHAGGPSPASYDLLAFRDFGTPQRAPARDFEPHPLVCVLGTDTDHPAAQVRAGMALHRVLLAATQAGLASSMLSQPIEVPELRSQLRTALGRTGGWPQMVLRFGYGIPTPATPRRPVADILEILPAVTR